MSSAHIAGICHNGMDLRQERVTSVGGQRNSHGGDDGAEPGGERVRRFLFCLECNQAHPVPPK